MREIGKRVVVAVLLAFAMVATLTACGGGDPHGLNGEWSPSDGAYVLEFRGNNVTRTRPVGGWTWTRTVLGHVDFDWRNFYDAEITIVINDSPTLTISPESTSLRVLAFREHTNGIHHEEIQGPELVGFEHGYFSLRHGYRTGAWGRQDPVSWLSFTEFGTPGDTPVTNVSFTTSSYNEITNGTFSVSDDGRIEIIWEHQDNLQVDDFARTENTLDIGWQRYNRIR